jgi:hypothetical protein
MADTLEQIALEKLTIKKDYDSSINKIQEEEYRDTARMEENIRVMGFNFETETLSKVTLLKQLQDKEEDPRKRAAIQTQIEKTQKQRNINLTDLEVSWKRGLSNLKQSFTKQRNDLKVGYDGAFLGLTLREAAVKEAEKKKKPTVPEELLIARTPYPKWWRDSLNAKIELIAPGSQVLATVSGNLRLFVATIILTVTGETVITFTFGNAGSSGPIYLGGENQPMGIVIAMGNSPAPCGQGILEITATDPTAVTPSVGGWATCFAEEK